MKIYSMHGRTWKIGDRVELPDGMQGVVESFKFHDAQTKVTVRLGTQEGRKLLREVAWDDLKPGVKIVTEADIKARGDAHLLAALG